ncbi:MAG: EthD domain-containing protein [Minwuia sp.]|uniref:EthD domain-containing protein n=1 Tax=Minwuia sp. TaxID=2493630 RepID=UPI003A83ECB4
MIKSVLAFKRRPGMPVDEFQDYWLNEHPKAVLKLDGLQRYVQDHPLKQGYDKRALPHDGFAETWWPDTETMKRNAESPVWPELVADEEKFIDRSSMQLLLVEELVMKDEPVAADGFKIIEIVHRRKGMTVEDCQRHWREIHGPLGASIPAVRRYIQNHARLSAYANGRQPFCDGFAMVWFNSMADMRASPETKQYKATMADEPNFIDHDKLDFVITKEHVIRG